MIKDLILVNGEIMERSKAVIAFGDRGQQFGDGVFELVPVYNGRCFALLPHMNSVGKLMIGMPELPVFWQDICANVVLKLPVVTTTMIGVMYLARNF